MANTIKQKRGTSDPGASDLVVGELAINTTDGGVFTKTDGGSVVEVGSGGGGASAINDLSDAVTKDGGVTIGLGTGALANDDDSDNNNTALGYNALNANTSGRLNTVVGYQAGAAITTALRNCFFGEITGGAVTTGSYCTAFGARALSQSTTSDRHTAIGYQSLVNVGSGTGNTAVGHTSGKGIYSSGANNSAFGHEAGSSSWTGSNNTCLGYNANPSSSSVSNEITLGNSSVTSLRIPGLQSGASNGQVLTYNSTNGNITLADAGGGGASAINDLSDAITNDSGETIGLGTGALVNDDGSFNVNTAVGYNAFNSLTSASKGVAIGHSAGQNLTTGNQNVFVGYRAGRAHTSGFQSVIIGNEAGKAITSAGRNNAIGAYALSTATTATECMAFGMGALQYVTTGSQNVGIGRNAGDNITTGSNNLCIGTNVDASSATVSNEITLGNSSVSSLRIPGLQSGASNGQVLTYNSTNGNIALADASSTEVLISSSVFTSAVSSVDFTNISGYTSYKLKYMLQTSSAGALKLRVGIDGTYDSGANYNEGGSNTKTSVGLSGGFSAQALFGELMIGSLTEASATHFAMEGVTYSNDSTASNILNKGFGHRTAAAQNCISVFGSGNIPSGSIALFGIKYS